jgi:tetratricopeptide (TPR) repeat protein
MLAVACSSIFASVILSQEKTASSYESSTAYFTELEAELTRAVSLKSTNIDSALLLLSSISRKSILLKADVRRDFQAKVLTELGNTNRINGNYLEAIKYYEQGLQFSTIHNLELRRAKLFNALGGLYQEVEDLEKAFKYCSMALNIFQTKFPNEKTDLCMLYANVGNLLVIMKKNGKAENYLLKALEINEELKNDYLSTLIYSGLGIVKMRFEDFDAALSYFNIGLKSTEKTESIDTKLALVANISSTYIQLKRYREAEDILLPAYQDALNEKHTYLTKEILALLVVLYANTERFQKAYDFQKKYSDLKSELFTEELNHRMASVESKLKSTERQKKILELNQLNQTKGFEIRKNRFIFILVSVLLGSALIILWFFFQRAKHKNIAKIYQMENQMFRLQMKPHFIFNVLSSIGGYMNQNNAREASTYLAKFARLIRNVLEQSNQELIPVRKELELLKYYLDLQQMRFPEKFTYTIDTEDIIETENLYIPPMLLQPIVENAIEHGFSKLKRAGNLEISFTQTENHLIIEICDDGIGINQNLKTKNNTDFSNIKTDSISSKLIVDHLKYYKMKLRKEFHITFEDLSETNKDLTGTSVQLTLPIINKSK